MSAAEDISIAEEEENCDSIKWFASISKKKMNIETSSLDDFIRMLNIFMTVDIEKCDSFFTSVSNNIFKTFYLLLKKFVSEQNVQMQNIERHMYKVQNIRGYYLMRIGEMFTFLRQADDDRTSGKSNSEIKEDFFHRFSRDNILAKNIYNLVKWKKTQKELTSDDMLYLAITGAQMGGKNKRKKNVRSGSRSRGRNSHRKMNHKQNKNKSRRALHIKKKQ
jgi:hypothetical protein